MQQNITSYWAKNKHFLLVLQAPSTSLCISILNLHGSGRECGRLILALCDDLSCFLKPIAPGVPNPEVDYNLIMRWVWFRLCKVTGMSVEDSLLVSYDRSYFIKPLALAFR